MTEAGRLKPVKYGDLGSGNVIIDDALRTKFEEWYPGLTVTVCDQQPEAVPMAT